MKIGIIGTAGRHEDGPKMTLPMWETMNSHIRLVIEKLTKHDEPIDLVSGGAACADHLAVNLWLKGIGDSLTLHLPAAFHHSRFETTKGKLDPGRIASYYHEMAQRRTHVDGLRDIQRAIEKGAVVTVSPGFHARNLLVGDVDLLVAYTFGTRTCLVTSSSDAWKNHTLAGLKDGGTAHTWDNSNAPIKLHTNLQDWC